MLPLAAAICSIFAVMTAPVRAADAPAVAEGRLTTVHVVQVQKVAYSAQVMLTGVLAARVQKDLSFRTGGRILTRNFDVGDHVQAGDLMATLDSVYQRATLESMRASSEAAEAQLRQATATFDRQKTLLAGGFTTRRDYETAERTLKTATAAAFSAKEQIRIAEDALSFVELRADAPGIVTARNADVGEVVQTAQAVFGFAEDGLRDVVFEVNEAMLLRRVEGEMPITVSLADRPEVTATGIVRQVAPLVNTATGTIRVKVGLTTPVPDMKLGAPVVGTARPVSLQAVILPWTALSSLGDKPAVWVFDPKSRAINLRAVTTLAYETGRVILSGGLEAGESVVTSSSKQFRPGQIVEPMQEAAR